MTTVSVCIPTFERPELLERALTSVLRASEWSAGEVEVLVSDDSRDDRSASVCERRFAEWHGAARHIHNRPPLGMVRNFNQCVAAARGRYILILHDDDYLLPGGIDELVRFAAAAADRPVTLFGVDVVDAAGRTRRRQSFAKELRLRPDEAVARVLSNSSFVRFPGIVVSADAYRAVGPFDVSLAGATDLDMWTRLFARFGLTCWPTTISAYSVHGDAHTTTMFTSETVARVASIFDRVAADGPLPASAVRSCERDFFAQFILGGAYRRLREGDRAGARRLLELFALPRIRQLGPSPRWRSVRVAMSILARTPGPFASLAPLLDRLYQDDVSDPLAALTPRVR